MSTPSPCGKDHISELPAELLYQVYAHLPPSSLYDLAKLKRHLNHTALDFLFKQHSIGYPNNGWISIHRAPREILPAIHNAFFINKLDNYHIYLPSDLNDVIFDLRVIKVIIRRCGLKSLKLFFSDLDAWISTGGADYDATHKLHIQRQSRDSQRLADPGVGYRRTLWQKKVNVETWRSVLLDALEEALKNGCSQLELTGGGYVPHMYCDPSGKYWEEADENDIATDFGVPEGVDKEARVKDGVQAESSSVPETDITEASTSRFVWTTPLSPRPNQTFPNNQLTSLSVDSSLILEPPLRAWTIHLLNNSPLLTALSVKTQTIFPTAYAEILPFISIPSLKELSFVDMNIPWTDLTAFLSRHGGTLIKLSVYLTSMAGTLPRKQIGFEIDLGWDSEDGFSRKVSMPLLEEVTMNMVYLDWFFSEPSRPNSNADAGRRQNTPLNHRFPCLHGISFVTDRQHWHPSPLDHYYVARTLARIGKYIASFDGSGHKSRLGILTFRCHDSVSLQPILQSTTITPNISAPGTDSGSFDFDAIINSDAGPGSRASDPTNLIQILPHLCGITILRFSGNWFQDFPDQILELLPTFARRFPDVEVLEITGHWDFTLEKMRKRMGKKMVNGSKADIGVIEDGCWTIRLRGEQRSDSWPQYECVLQLM